MYQELLMEDLGEDVIRQLEEDQVMFHQQAHLKEILEVVKEVLTAVEAEAELLMLVQVEPVLKLEELVEMDHLLILQVRV